MSIDKRMLTMAADVARDVDRLDNRSFFLGAVGLRNDGVIVTAKNIASKDVVPTHHAEARVVRKLTPNSTVWWLGCRERRANGRCRSPVLGAKGGCAPRE